MTESISNALVWLPRLQQMVLASYYGLLGCFLLGAIVALGGISAATPVIWLIQAIPLLIFARGLHQKKLRTYAWMSFVVLLYFCNAVLIAFDPERRWLGLLEVFFTVSLFVVLVIYIRLYRNHYQVGI